ncbi:MAG: DNA primase, partial [Richelia sp. SM2_1_7]|nr:DNA primase [Richelia sp. SM2_1_7]
SHHRFLWQQIVNILDANSSTELISTLQDKYLEFPEQMEMISHLFHISEKAQQEIIRTPIQILRATLSMERVLHENATAIFMNFGSKLIQKLSQKNTNLIIKLLSLKIKQLKKLDKQRCFNVGEF